MQRKIHMHDQVFNKVEDIMNLNNKDLARFYNVHKKPLISRISSYLMSKVIQQDSLIYRHNIRYK